jgi:transposase-like protein
MPVRLKNIVQMDEGFFGGHEANMHKDKKSKTKAQMNQRKTPVFGIIEEGGKVVVQASKWMNKRNAEKLLLTHVDKDATLVTDAFKMYKIIGAKHFKKHVSVNHLKGEFKVDGFHTNGIENFWSQLKRSVYGIYHQVSSKHLQRYCDEMAYRFNSRKIKDADRFTIALQNCQGRLNYHTLINNSLTLDSYGKEIKEIGNQEN